MKKQLLHLLMVLGVLSIALVSCKDDDDNDNNNNGNTGNEVVSGFITENTTWTNDHIYELSGKVVVRDGVTLTIEEGSLIKGQSGTGSAAAALVVERGAKIEAVGTAANPIIFTSTSDNIELGQIAGTNLDETVNELWGGVIILGKATVSTEDGDTEGQIEGLPASETYGTYGGSNDADNSGTLKYVSIRHGGAVIGADNEINGLTLGGVGSGTTIDYVEIVANLDDGVEFFGGTVDASNIVVIYQGDDAIDIDQNYSGTINNVLVVTGDGIGTDEALEIDGPEGTASNGLFTISNGTFITEGTEGSGADLKSKAQGTIEDCRFEGFEDFVKVRTSFSDTTNCTDKTDAYTNITGSSLTLSNVDFVGANSMDDVSEAYTKSCSSCGCLTTAYETAVDAAVNANGNSNPGSSTKGATVAAFAGWTWADENGKL